MLYDMFQRPTTRNCKMAFQTRSSIIYVFILHNIVIPAMNMGVSSRLHPVHKIRFERILATAVNRKMQYGRPNRK